MAKSSSRYQRQDRFFKKAKQDKFVARSVYKLDELDRRYGLLSKNQTVVDLGCAPGSWLQYLAEKVGKRGRVVGYDLVPVELGLPSRVAAHVADVTALTAPRVWADLRALGGDPADGPPPRVDALISDMAPKLTGVRDADQARSVGLVRFAVTLARQLLGVDRGVFVAKLFQGRDTDELVAEVKSSFREVKLLKPEATRDGSREVFVLGRKLRPGAKQRPADRPATDDGEPVDAAVSIDPPDEP